MRLGTGEQTKINFNAFLLRKYGSGAAAGDLTVGWAPAALAVSPWG